VESNPNEAMVRLDYARALLLAERGTEAEAQLRPIPQGLHPSVSVFLAQSLIFQERMDEAREVIESGLRLFPDEARLKAQLSQVEAGS
jgi:thioredoxin-like negative regulator of GroEL